MKYFDKRIFIIFQGDTEITRSGKYAKRQQLVADSKANLEQLVEHMEFVVRFVKNSESKLHVLVKKCQGKPQKGCKGVQQPVIRESAESVQEEIGPSIDEEDNDKQSRHREREGSGVRNEQEEFRYGSDGDDDKELTCEDKLLVLLDIEERLRMLQDSEDCLQLWEEVRLGVREWYLQALRLYAQTEMETKGFKLQDSVVRCLWMMWKCKDSVWLLGLNLQDDERVRLLQKVRDIMQCIYHSDIPSWWHPHIPVDRGQLLEMSQQRLSPECIEELRLLIQHKNPMQQVLESSVGELQRLVAECRYNMQQSLEERQQARQYISEDILWLLQEINGRLWMINCVDYQIQLWYEIRTGVCEWWWTKCQMEEVQQSMEMMWESNDSVWLLGCVLSCAKRKWLPWRIREIIQQIHPTEIRAEWHPQTLADGEQLLRMFRNRFHLWQDRSKSFQHQYQDMEAMLKNWPQQCKVRTMLR